MRNTTLLGAFFFNRMSIQIISMVWNCTALQEHSEVLVMMALADWANDDGQSFPSVYRLCRKARISEATWKRVKLDLVKNGYLTVDMHQGAGTAFGATNLFQINLDALEGGSPRAPRGGHHEPHIRQYEPSTPPVVPPRGTSLRDKKSTDISDDEFFKELKKSPAYSGIDIDVEREKMRLWQLVPRNSRRRITRQFVLNWLGKADLPVDLNSKKGKLSPEDQAIMDKPENELTDAERKHKNNNLRKYGRR